MAIPDADIKDRIRLPYLKGSTVTMHGRIILLEIA
jgi:hypothetical protein